MRHACDTHVHMYTTDNQVWYSENEGPANTNSDVITVQLGVPFSSYSSCDYSDWETKVQWFRHHFGLYFPRSLELPPTRLHS